jgi:hypothetical protein
MKRAECTLHFGIRDAFRSVCGLARILWLSVSVTPQVALLVWHSYMFFVHSMYRVMSGMIRCVRDKIIYICIGGADCESTYCTEVTYICVRTERQYVLALYVLCILW